jgi:ATP-dependent helicase/nuclease subunit B
LAQRLYDITALEPLAREGFTLLTPNRRLARRIKAQWDERRAAAGERTWQPFPVQTLENWLLGRWELAVSLGLLPPVAPLGAAQALELWRQVIGEHQPHSAHYQLLLPAAAADIAHQARESLRRWQVNTAAPGIRQLFMLERDCQTFWQWQQAFESRLEKSGLCMPVDCLAQLPAVAPHLPRSRVALLEFDEIQPLLRTALDAVCEQVQDIAWPTANAHRLVHHFSDKRAELRAVASWAGTVHRANPATKIGIVPADANSDRVALEYLLRREFDCLGKNYNSLPVNFSTGIPLAQAPLVRDALRVLSLGLPQTTVPVMVGLMHSRFLGLQNSRSEFQQQLLNRLHAAGRETVAVGDLRIAAQACAANDDSEPSLAQRLQTLSTRRELRRAATPSAWAAHFSTVLAEWDWPGQQSLDSVEYQQLEQWYGTLDEFRAFDAVCGKLRYGEALSLLADCCSRAVSHPQSADTPIQVLGPLEAAGLAFDHLWVCGMQAARWPASPQPNPFIPISLQTRLRMPHANPEREQAFSSALLRRYSRASQTLHASYARQIDGVPAAPSAILLDFEVQVIPEPPAVPTQWMTALDECDVEQVADHCAPRLDPFAQSAITGGSLILEDQSHCPFRAFARHRLQINRRQLGSGVQAGERGSLLHAALYALWASLGTLNTLQAMDPAAQAQAVANAIDNTLGAVPAATRRAVSAGYWRLERQRLGLLLRDWLAVERQRSEFMVVAQEQAFTLELAGLSLRLRVDRIDQLPDGSRVIIDYKSGNCSVRDWLGDRPARPQLPLYAIAEPNTAAAVTFAHVSTRNCGFVGLGRVAAAEGIRTDIPRAVDKQMAAGDWQTLNERWRNNLERLAHAFVAGEAQVDPRSTASCEHCGLQPLCRVAASDATAEESAL